MRPCRSSVPSASSIPASAGCEHAARLEQPGPTPESAPQQERGKARLPARNPTGAPTIPHRVASHQVDLNTNRCMHSQGEDAPEAVGATPLPASHRGHRSRFPRGFHGHDHRPGSAPGLFVVGVHAGCTHHTRTVTLQTGVVDDAGHVVPAHLVVYRIGVRNVRSLHDTEGAREENACKQWPPSTRISWLPPACCMYIAGLGRLGQGHVHMPSTTAGGKVPPV